MGGSSLRTGMTRASLHAGHLQLPSTLESFCFFSLHKAQEETMQSCLKLAGLELEITHQTNLAMMNQIS